MDRLQSALAEMKIRINNVEVGLTQLRDETRESGGRLEGALAEMHRNSEEMHRNSEEMHKNSEEMRKNSVEMHKISEEMRKIAEEMRKNSEEMRRTTGALERSSEAFEKSSEAMYRESARHTARFDQITTDMLENVRHYQGNVAQVAAILVERDLDLTARQDALEQRVDAIERRLAG